MATKKSNTGKQDTKPNPKPTANKTTNAQTPDLRRPPSTPTITPESILTLRKELTLLKNKLEGYAMHMRPLDRKRLNSIGVRKLGFARLALDIAQESPEFMPNWLSYKQFVADAEFFTSVQELTLLTDQIREMLWNIQIDAADIFYTDALEYYAMVREAAKRRVDAAETPFKRLREFFRKWGRRMTEEPTEKQLKKDFNALLHGKRDGKIEIENINPKTTKGKRVLVDEKYQDTVKVRKTEDEELDE